MSEVHYPMKAVSERTGLSPHVLRVWERRYQAVTPARSDTNRRLYTAEEIERLGHLARLTNSGHGISHLASLPNGELATMAASLDPLDHSPSDQGSVESILEEAWSLVIDLDSSALHSLLERAAVILGVSKLSQKVIVPLIERIGRSWETGEISQAEEHAASAVIKELLFSVSRPFAQSSGAPNLLVATPRGQLHELGAVLVSSIARRDGWNVTYLGPSLPAAEIARAAIQNHSLAVGLSIVYPSDDATLPDELRLLAHDLPPGVAILIGGRAAPAHKETIAEIDATLVNDLSVLTKVLRDIRAKPRS